MPISYIGKGTFASGAGDVVPGLPAGMAAGDLMIMVVHSVNQTITFPTGWQQIPAHSGTAERGSAGVAGGVMVRVGYRWWQSGDTDPTVTDTGDMTAAIIFGFTNVDPTTPFDNATPVGFNAAAATTLTLTGITTNTDYAYIMHCVALDVDTTSTAVVGAPTNANLARIAEIHDQAVVTNSGGGIYAMLGCKLAAGATGNTTTAAGTSTAIAGITLALRPRQPPSYIVQRKSTSSNAPASVAQSFNTLPTVGNYAVVLVSGVGTGGGTPVVLAISDNQGNTYTLANTRYQIDVADTAELLAEMYTAPINTSSGTFTITLTTDGTANYTVTIVEVRGLGAEDQNGATGSTTNAQTSLTLTAAGQTAVYNELVFTVITTHNNSGVFTEVNTTSANAAATLGYEPRRSVYVMACVHEVIQLTGRTTPSYVYSFGSCITTCSMLCSFYLSIPNVVHRPQGLPPTHMLMR